MVTTTNALQLLQDEDNRIKNGFINNTGSRSGLCNLLTFIRGLDLHLKGGLPVGKGIIEVSGLPSTGKTQWMMQLMVMCQIPTMFGGLEKGAICIDTESSCCPVRLSQLTRNIQEHLLKKASEKGVDELMALVKKRLNIDSVLENIHVLRVYDAAELLAATMTIEPFMRRIEQRILQDDRILPIGLVIIDSVAFPFRSISESGFKKRSLMLSGLVQKMNALALVHQLCIVVTNHMTYKADNGYVPCLGEAWGHHPILRFILEFAEQQPNKNDELHYILKLVKSAWIPPVNINVYITDAGIREKVVEKEETGVNETAI